MRRNRVIAFAFALLLAVGLHAGAADWPQWRGPDRDGTTTAQGLDPAFGKKLRAHKVTSAGLDDYVTAVVHAYLAEIGALDAELAAGGEPLETIRTELAEGVELLRNATDLLLARENPNDILAGATPYLRLFGTVAGAYYMAREALVAVRALQGGGDDGFLAAKLATARFYCEQLLPQAFGLVPAATAHADPLFAIEPKLLGA